VDFVVFCKVFVCFLLVVVVVLLVVFGCCWVKLNIGNLGVLE